MKNIYEKRFCCPKCRKIFKGSMQASQHANKRKYWGNYNIREDTALKAAQALESAMTQRKEYPSGKAPRQTAPETALRNIGNPYVWNCEAHGTQRTAAPCCGLATGKNKPEKPCKICGKNKEEHKGTPFEFESKPEKPKCDCDWNYTSPLCRNHEKPCKHQDVRIVARRGDEVIYNCDKCRTGFMGKLEKVRK